MYKSDYLGGKLSTLVTDKRKWIFFEQRQQSWKTLALLQKQSLCYLFSWVFVEKRQKGNPFFFIKRTNEEKMKTQNRTRQCSFFMKK